MQGTLQHHDYSPLRSFGKHRFNSNLTKFSLNLESGWGWEGKAALGANYPSPPMSGSPPPPDKRPHSPDQNKEQQKRQPPPPSSSTVLAGREISRIPEPEVVDGSGQRPQGYPAGPALDFRRTQTQEQAQAHPLQRSVFPSYPPPIPPRTSSLHATAQGARSTESVPASYSSSRTQRRTKAHTASACINCKKAHLRCETQRPCERCIKSNKQSSCIDVEHKKRGRPRLREDREGRRNGSPAFQPSQTTMPPPLMSPQLSPTTTARPDPMLRAPYERVGRPQAEPQSFAQGFIQTPPGVSSQQGRIGTKTGFQPPPPNQGYREAPPVAFLTVPEFIVVKASQAFHSAIPVAVNKIHGQRLEDLVIPTDVPKISLMQQQIQMERETRESAWLPPIFEDRDPQKVIQDIQEGDYATITHGYADDRFETVSFGTPRHFSTIPCQIKLAKAALIFAVITLWPANHPALQTRSIPPPYSRENHPHMFPPYHMRIGPSPSYEQRRSSHPTSAHSSAPPSPYYSTSQPVSYAARDERVSPRNSQQYDPGYFPAIANYSGASAASPITTYTHPSPSLSQSRTPRTPYNSMSQGPGVESLQLPPIRESSFTKPPSVTPRRRRRSEGDTGADAGGEEGKEEHEGNRGRRKRAKVDLKEVLE